MQKLKAFDASDALVLAGTAGVWAGVFMLLGLGWMLLVAGLMVLVLGLAGEFGWV